MHLMWQMKWNLHNASISTTENKSISNIQKFEVLIFLKKKMKYFKREIYTILAFFICLLKSDI